MLGQASRTSLSISKQGKISYRYMSTNKQLSSYSQTMYWHQIP